MAEEKKSASGAPPGFRFVPLDSPEGQSLAAGQPTAELTTKDREELAKFREALNNINATMPEYLKAEQALRKIDEGPISGRIGNLFAATGLTPNTTAYETVNAARDKLATIGLREVGGNDTEKEWQRLANQAFGVEKTPGFNAGIFKQAKLIQKLAEEEIILAEQWLSNFGSFTARNPKGSTFEQSRRKLRDKYLRQAYAERSFNRGGWSITPVGRK